MPRSQLKKDTHPWIPPNVRSGPEIIALSRFLWDGTWTGTVEAGGMGPGSPEMEGKGKATCERIIDGLWISCSFTQDQYTMGKKVLTWKARFIVGWDVRAQEYRAVGVDSNGSAFIFHGVIQGDQLILESMVDESMRLRFTWDATDSTAMTWRNEISIRGAPWTLIEEYTLYPT